jgi:hypothetical protein
VTTFAVVFLLGVFAATGLWVATRDEAPARMIAGTPSSNRQAAEAPARGEPETGVPSQPGARAGDAAAPVLTDGSASGDGGAVVDSGRLALTTRPTVSQRFHGRVPDGGRVPVAPATVDASVEHPAEESTPEPAPGPDVAALLREADGLCRSRGLRPGDDREADRLRAAAARLIAQSVPAEQSAQAVAQYRRRVEAVAINRAFVDAKMRRVSRRIAALDDDSPLAGELSALSQQAMRRAIAGDYDGANRLLNRILERAGR